MQAEVRAAAMAAARAAAMVAAREAGILAVTAEVQMDEAVTVAVELADAAVTQVAVPMGEMVGETQSWETLGLLRQ